MRKRYIPLIITILLCFVSIGVALASTELAYDDGEVDLTVSMPQGLIDADGRYAVRFTTPDATNLLTKCRFYTSSSGEWLQDVNIHVLESTKAGLTTVTHTPTQGWNDVILSSPIIVTGDFYVSIEYLTATKPVLGADRDSVLGRTWLHSNLIDPHWQVLADYDPEGINGQYNYMIRAVVERVPGGVIPEVPYGTITTLALLLLGFALYVKRPF